MSIEDDFVHDHIRRDAGDTEDAAARRAHGTAEEVKARILRLLGDRGPLPHEAMEDALEPFAHSTVRARCSDLVHEGKVREHRDERGKPVRTVNRRGNTVKVWALVPEAVRA